jgi:hypothetical protein
MSAEIAVSLAPEMEPPAKRPRSKSTGKGRPPPRPYRKITSEVLASRIQRLTVRIDKAKKQHEATRLLLTKYAHERFYRERDVVAEAPDPQQQPPAIAALAE